MKQNLVVLLADLFNLFEIHPAKCVAYPGMNQQIASEFTLYNLSSIFIWVYHMEHCTVHSKYINRKPHSIDIEMN